MKRIRLGSVSVDSGQLMICDPCYVLREDGNPHITYDEVCDVTLKGNGGEVKRGIAVAFPSGLGDGQYDVYATILNNTETGGWGERVTKVEIELLPEYMEKRPYGF